VSDVYCADYPEASELDSTDAHFNRSLVYCYTTFCGSIEVADLAKLITVTAEREDAARRAIAS
jgi:hypothetical protein